MLSIVLLLTFEDNFFLNHQYSSINSEKSLNIFFDEEIFFELFLSVSEFHSNNFYLN